MTKKKVLFPLAAAALLAVCGASALQAGAVVYNIVDYPGLENGWTVSGTITTDGTIGTLSASNITAWSWTLTNGGTTDTWSSTVTGSLYAADQVSGLTATATELELGTPGSDQESDLILGYGGGPGSGGDLYWNREGAAGIFFPAIETYIGDFGGLTQFDSYAYNLTGLTLTDSTNWVIAEVPSQSSSAPEPGTVALFVRGVAGIAVGRTRRKA